MHGDSHDDGVRLNSKGGHRPEEVRITIRLLLSNLVITKDGLTTVQLVSLILQQPYIYLLTYSCVLRPGDQLWANR